MYSLSNKFADRPDSDAHRAPVTLRLRNAASQKRHHIPPSLPSCTLTNGSRVTPIQRS